MSITYPFAPPITPQTLLEYLEDLGIETQTATHPALHSVSDSQSYRGDIEGIHCKNLFVKDKKGQYFLLVMEENAEIDLKQVHKLIGGSGRVSFGRPEQLMEYLGVKPGSVTPFSVINDVENKVQIFLDEAMMQEPTLNYHPLLNEMTTTIKREDLIKFLQTVHHEPKILALSV
jgi:Ala-tRNA(Pro) deacylase